MPPLDTTVFQTERALAALEKYAAVTGLTVQVYDCDEHLVTAPIGSNPLFQLFSKEREPGILRECIRRCLAGSDEPIVTEDGHGLAIVGSPVTLAGGLACVVGAGISITRHFNQREVQRLGRDSSASFDLLWSILRRELPIPRARLVLYADLLRILGETLLSEHYRTLQVEETMARLKADDRAKDEFLAMLSHELRNPLNTILGWSRMLRAGDLDPAMRSYALETIERNSMAQARLINDLLDISRIVARKLRLDFERVEVVPLLEEVLDEARQMAQAKDIRLESWLDPSVGSVTGDPDRLKQIFMNLLSNSLKFTSPGGTVTVNLQRLDSSARVTVRDTGTGINPQFLPNVFDSFRQADSTIARAQGGLGLGLAIVQHLVEQHGGNVRADSPGEGQGATFTVTLPVLDLPREPRREPVPLASTSSTSLNGAQVWIVDDDPSGRKLLTMMLVQKGAQVTAFASAYDALKGLDESQPEVLVCDVGMPGMDGYSFMRQVRARDAEHGGHVPAIAQTGYATPDDRERALSAGFQIHFGKPLNLTELLDAVAQLAGSKI